MNVTTEAAKVKEDKPGMLSVADVASRLDVPAASVVYWIDSGQLEAVNVAKRQGPGCRRRWRISPAALAAFERNRGSRPPAAQPPAAISNSRLPKRAGNEEQFV